MWARVGRVTLLRYRRRRRPNRAACSVARRVVDHRVSDAAVVLQLVVALAEQRSDRVRGEEFWGHAFLRRLPGDGLGAVLAELKRGGVFLVWPGAPNSHATARACSGKRRPMSRRPASVARVVGSAPNDRSTSGSSCLRRRKYRPMICTAIKRATRAVRSLQRPRVRSTGALSLARPCLRRLLPWH